MANPFFSGRIPQSLHNRIEQYISESGKSKTELLINALSSYLDFPVEAKEAGNNNEKLWIVVKELQKRLEVLEQGSTKGNVITLDNNDNNTGNEKPSQLNLLEDNTKEEKESIKGKMLEINEILSLPGLEKLDSGKLITKLRNARSQNKLPIQVGKYLIGDGGKNPEKPRGVLWKIISDN